MARKARFEMQLPPELLARIRQQTKFRGFRDVSSFVRAAVQSELRSGDSALDRTEQKMAASIERLSQDIRVLHTAQQALFALNDSLVKVLLTSIPEPPAETLDQARRRAKLRYERFMLSVAQNMNTEARDVVKTITDRS